LPCLLIGPGLADYRSKISDCTGKYERKDKWRLSLTKERGRKNYNVKREDNKVMYGHKWVCNEGRGLKACVIEYG
jgi:hypothetical protein